MPTLSIEYLLLIINCDLDEGSLREIFHTLNGLDYKWFHLGLALGVPYHSLKNIESSGEDERGKMWTMLIRWWQDRHARGPEVATWRFLIAALRGPLVSECKVALQLGQHHPNIKMLTE